MAETWRFAYEHPDYMVSSLGKVLSLKRRKLIASFDNHGYCRVVLNSKAISLHRLVLLTFKGEPPPGFRHANHKNFDRADNRLVNLEWVTPKENVKYSADKGHREYLRGVHNHKAKLTEEQVREIRASGWTPENNPHKAISAPKLARKYGVSHQTILGVLRGEFWKHLL